MALVKKNALKSNIDNSNQVTPAIDYSFCSLSSVSDTLDEEPRNAKELGLTPRVQFKKKKDEEEEQPKSKSRAFFLNNNSIGELSDLRSTMEKIFENVDNVAWLNLSLNIISTLDPLLQLPHLEILYLHGNCITDMAEIEKLGSLQHLKKATFHGNPVEKFKGYRQFVLSHLVHLKVLDFSNVTREDRTRIQSWKMVNKSKKKKTVEKED